MINNFKVVLEDVMSFSANSRFLGRILRLPGQTEVRDRLAEKLIEYQRRRQRYLQQNQIAGLGVLVGDDKALLDAHYKETLFSILLKERVLKVGRVYHQLKHEFRGFMDDALFHNAIQVLGDYVRTGGSNTSGGSGFLNEKMLHKLLGEGRQIEIPENQGLRKLLKRKYHEYLGRMMDHELHPDEPANEEALVRDAYKARIIDLLQQDGVVDIPDLAAELEENEADKFRQQSFLQAVSVVQSYCTQNMRQLSGGTGLH